MLNNLKIEQQPTQESVIVRTLLILGTICFIHAYAYADKPNRDAPNTVKMTGIYIWKNALEATFTPVKDKTNTWEVVFVATDHGNTSRYEGTVTVDMDGGAASGTVGFAGGYSARTAAWTLEGTMQDGILQFTVDEVDGTEDCAVIELAIVKQHAKKEAVDTASVKLKGHYVFGKNNVVEATFTAMDGKKHTWDVVFVAVYENIKWTYKGTVLADIDGGNVSGELAKDGGGAPWVIEGNIKDGVLKCACEDRSGKESSATIELKVVKHKERQE